MTSKTPDDSKAQVIIRMFPSDANPAGNVFGGVILRHIDMVAGIVAQRHSQTNAVTVSMDKISFLKPVLVGNVLFLNARINYAQNSSMEIEVQVEAEDIPKGTRVLTGTAFVTFVALDKKGKPIKIPKLVVKSKEDKKRFEQGKLRMERRIKERKTWLNMIKTPCPICHKDIKDHDKKKIDKCLWRFVREARNPVVYASREKLICPVCEEEMLDHNTKEAYKCVDQFIKDVEELDII